MYPRISLRFSASLISSPWLCYPIPSTSPLASDHAINKWKHCGVVFVTEKDLQSWQRWEKIDFFNQKEKEGIWGEIHSFFYFLTIHMSPWWQETHKMQISSPSSPSFSVKVSLNSSSALQLFMVALNIGSTAAVQSQMPQPWKIGAVVGVFVHQRNKRLSGITMFFIFAGKVPTEIWNNWQVSRLMWHCFFIVCNQPLVMLRTVRNRGYKGNFETNGQRRHAGYYLHNASVPHLTVLFPSTDCMHV